VIPAAKPIARSAGWVLLGALLLLFIGCAGSSDADEDPQAKSIAEGVETLAGEAELEAYLKEQIARSVNPDVAGVDGSPESDSGQPSDTSDGAGGAADMAEYTGTNLQEAGVDEGDLVKTDGNYLYVASGEGFEIVDLADEMAIAATGQVGGPVSALYHYGDRLVVLYRVSPADAGDLWPEVDLPAGGLLFGWPYWIPVETGLGVAVYDVSDPYNPQELKSLELDGYLVSSRRTGGRLHLVQQFRPVLPPLIHWYDGGPADLDAAIAANRAAIAEMTLEELIPHYREAGASADATLGTPLVAAEDFYCPVSKNGGGTITTVVSFDLDDPQLPFTSTGIVADAHIVYASPESLYTATHRYHFDADLSEETTIYKFDLTGDQVRFAGSGIVAGWILNQFSLGEFEGVLRVATTTGHAGGWADAARNQVYCLRLADEDLEVIGKVADLAPGEEIYAARFLGPRGYLVTFVKIDPLFTLDLSDPAAPRVVGELKVPGYSDYIHPLGTEHLITVGKDADFVAEDNMAWYQGVQLSIFDVSDFAAPALKHKLILGDRPTATEVAHNHKAFTFWSDKNLLALPIDLFEYAAPPVQPWEFGAHSFSGLYVYRVSTDDGFVFLGRISTREADSGDGWFTPWTRGVFVDETVCAVTADAVRRAPLDDIGAGVDTLPLNSGESSP
jgi:uncharacterized secreted protein with C-terminal beta-propeller domain